jgi:hypothetical protein
VLEVVFEPPVHFEGLFTCLKLKNLVKYHRGPALEKVRFLELEVWNEDFNSLPAA